MSGLETFRNWIGMITQIVLVLVPLAIVLTILFGTENLWVFGAVVGNLINLLNTFGSHGLVGLIALGIVIWLFANYGGASKTSGQY